MIKIFGFYLGFCGIFAVAQAFFKYQQGTKLTNKIL
jgi:hypothetical protein